jgi:monoamine oxidase
VTIGVVGLGISGLRTAMLLEGRGFDVKLFEARGRPGGRLHTIDEGQGTLYEAGGEWIDADHHRCLDLLKEFQLEPEGRPTWPQRVIFRTEMVTEDEIWNEALEDDLRVEAAARELCRDLKNPPWANIDHADLDQRTLGDFFREHTQSDEGLWWVTAQYRSDEGEDPDKIGLLGWLCGYIHYLAREGDVMSAYRVPGGFRSLCEKMVHSLRTEPHFAAVLHKITQDPTGVWLHFERSKERVDRVVITLPPPALERVVFEPALTVEKRCAVEACGMSRAVKICWEFDQPWWLEEGWGGSMLCDGPLQQTWDGTLGESPVLTAYVCGNQAAEWAKLGDPVKAGLYELGQIYPQAGERFVRGWWHDWVTDRFALGAFSHLSPGYVLDHMANIADPESKIHFAGEHTAEWIGFIEGALESAERVVGEIEASEC